MQHRWQPAARPRCMLLLSLVIRARRPSATRRPGPRRRRRPFYERAVGRRPRRRPAMDGCGRRRAVALRGSVRWLASHGSSAAAATYGTISSSSSSAGGWFLSQTAAKTAKTCKLARFAIVARSVSCVVADRMQHCIEVPFKSRQRKPIGRVRLPFVTTLSLRPTDV